MLNIFQGDAFSTVSLTKAFLATPYVPNLLGTLGIFEPAPITTDAAAIERLGQTLALVQTTPRGAPPATRGQDKRSVRDVRTVRLALNDRIYAHQVANLRAFGSETELETAQGFALKRMAKLRQDIELTWENLRMGCIKGVVKDADGTDIIDYFSFWGITAPDPVNFALTTDGTDVDGVCRAVIRQLEKSAEGGFLPTSRVIGLAGDNFFDALVKHPNVVKFYVNRSEADMYLANTQTRKFDFGGIRFINYRGTDDGTTLGVPTDDCRFVIAGGKDIFQMALSPMNESFEFMNTLGQEVYAMMVFDKDRQFWVDVEAYSYPLPICTRPKTLLRGIKASG